jgi:hypothetical protein
MLLYWGQTGLGSLWKIDPIHWMIPLTVIPLWGLYCTLKFKLLIVLPSLQRNSSIKQVVFSVTSWRFESEVVVAIVPGDEIAVDVRRLHKSKI